MRKDLLTNGQIYHVFNRSIADFKIFNSEADFLRMKNLIKYYQVRNGVKFSNFIELKAVGIEGFNNYFNRISADKEQLVQIVAYCLMPTHFHLVLKQLVDNGISLFMKNVLDSYTRFFNTHHKRKGPLWEGKFRNILVESDEQLLHLTIYLHLNPVTALLVDKPEDWLFSSYKEYLSLVNDSSITCKFNDILEIKPLRYSKFVNDQISYQRELAKIKKLLID